MSMVAKFYSKGDIDAFIGEDLIARYPAMYPFICYVIYRRGGDDIEVKDPVVRGYEGFLDFETSFLCSIKQPVKYVLRNIVRFFCFGGRTEHGAQDSVLLSQTLVYNKRFDMTLNALSKSARTAAFLCGSHIEGKDVLNMADSNAASLKKYGIQVIPAGDSLFGQRFYRLITRFGEITEELLRSNQPFVTARDRLEPLFEAMNRIVMKRLAFVKRLLKENGVQLYITINQYYVTEILIIMACRELGIRTKQLAHHPYSISLLPDESLPYFADDFCVWSPAELEWHRKHPFFYHCFSDDLPNMYYTGNLEIGFEEAAALTKAYPMERVITFMTSMVHWTDEADNEKEFQWRQELFQQLSILSQKQNVRIRIRYRPGDGGREAEVRSREAETVRGYGFEISPSDPPSLMSDILTSAAIITTLCSVACTAKVLGRNAYRMLPDFYHERYPFTDAPEGVTDIALSDVPDILVPAEATALNRDDFLNIERILEH